MPKVKFKRSGIITKIIVVALLLYLSVTLFSLRGQISSNETQLATLNEQVSSLTEENAQISEAIDGQDDPEQIQRAARDKGYVYDDEQIMVDVSD